MSIPLPILAALSLFVLIAGGVFIVGLTKKWGMLFPYLGMFLFASMSLPLTWNGRIRPSVWLPIQEIRSDLFLASGIAGMLIIPVQMARIRGKPMSLSTWLLVLIGVFSSLLRIIHDGPALGSLSVILSVCTLIPLAVTATMVLDEIGDIPFLLRVVAVMNVIWVLMVIVQIGVNPDYVTQGNQFRFVGIIGSPQHAGVLMAFLCVIVLWLLLNDERKYRFFYLSLLGINTLFLLWTGSRTGLGMTFIGISSVLYTRAGRAIFLLPIVAIVTYIAIYFLINVVGVNLGFERLTSTTNTREAAWKTLYTTAIENPLIGIGTTESTKSENSWLYGFAAFGIGMLVLTLLFTVVAFWEVVRLVRTRFWLPPHYRPYPDLIAGLITMYFAGAVFEGYIITRVSAPLCLYPLIAGAGAMIRRSAKEYHSSEYSDFNSDTYSDSDYGYEQEEYSD